jgi:urate oxidase
MERLRLSAVEIPFDPELVPSADGDGFAASTRLFAPRHDDRSHARLELERSPDGAVRVADLAAGRRDLQLIKLTGSSFADFARDDYTTLPERSDRPLYVHLDVGWRYADAQDALDASHVRYVAGEQIADLVAAVFERFVSLSIQHLVNEMGNAILERFPQLTEVSFEAQNRLWDTTVMSEADEQVRVYCDPRPPFGKIGLVLRRE